MEQATVTYKVVPVIDVRPAGDWRIWVKFEDGVQGEVDISSLRGKPRFLPLEDGAFFNRVHVHPDERVVSWGDDMEIGPVGMYDMLAHKPQPSNV